MGHPVCMLILTFTNHTHHVHLVLIESRHEEDNILCDVARIYGALPHHLDHHCVGVEEHFIAEAILDAIV